MYQWKLSSSTDKSTGPQSTPHSKDISGNPGQTEALVNQGQGHSKDTELV